MIKFDDFFKEITAKGKVKVKFNMNAGNKNYPALDLLLSDDLRWMEMNCWKSKQANNNYSDEVYENRMKMKPQLFKNLPLLKGRFSKKNIKNIERFNKFVYDYWNDKL